MIRLLIILILSTSCAQTALNKKERRVRIYHKSDVPHYCKKVSRFRLRRNLWTTEDEFDRQIKRAAYQRRANAVLINKEFKNMFGPIVSLIAYKCKKKRGRVALR